MNDLDNLRARARKRRAQRCEDHGLDERLRDEAEADLDYVIAMVRTERAAAQKLYLHTIGAKHDADARCEYLLADVLKLRDTFSSITHTHHHGVACQFCKTLADTDHYEQYR